MLRLRQRIVNNARSVHYSQDGQESRFSPQEQREILAHAQTASTGELDAVASMLRPDYAMPGKERHRRAKACVPMWVAPGDSQFLSALQMQIEARRQDSHRGPKTTAKQQPSAPSGIVPASAVSSSPGQRVFAVLLVDAEFCPHQLRQADTRREIKAMNEVLAQASAADVQVFELVWPGCFVTSEPLLKHRSHRNWTRIEKDANSGFVRTDLADKLAELGVTDVIMMGKYQELCVRATAADAHALNGVRVHVAADVVQGVSGTSAAFGGWYDPIAEIHSGHSGIIEALKAAAKNPKLRLS